MSGHVFSILIQVVLVGINLFVGFHGGGGLNFFIAGMASAFAFTRILGGKK